MRLNLKLGNLTIEWGNPCNRQECTYYKFYLQHVAPDLPHAAYHTAELACRDLQEAIYDRENRGQGVPLSLDRACAAAEDRIRA